MESKQIPLKMRCPTNCGNSNVYTWCHKPCSRSIIYLRSNGNLKCDSCYSQYNFLEWRFACEDHRGDYKVPDFMQIINALGAAAESCRSYFSSNTKESMQFFALVQANLLDKSYNYL